MPRAARRILSWLVTLGVLVAGGVALQRLPGGGELIDELRWLLAHSEHRPQLLNQATRLILYAGRDEPVESADLVMALLNSDDERVVRGMLTILPNCVDATVGDAAALGTQFLDWFEMLELRRKVRFLPQILVCCAWAVSGPGSDSPLLPAVTPLVHDWAVELTAADRQWLIAATLVRDPSARELADMLLFRHTAPAEQVLHRLAYLDGRTGAKHPDPLEPEGKLEPIGLDVLEAQLRLPARELPDMLSHPLPEVRQAAGRILAVCGDARGVPGVCEWVAANPRFAPRAAHVMTDLFGPGWRELCESGGTTRPASPGDGG